MAFTQEALCARLAHELGVRSAQVLAAVELLDAGATVPFVARYRKDVTGGLDDEQLRALCERRLYLTELEDRRDAVIEAIKASGKWTDAIGEALAKAETKQAVEDVYAPYKSRRQTRADKARAAGLEALLEAILADEKAEPEALAAGYAKPDTDYADAAAALAGAGDILSDRLAGDLALRAALRALYAKEGFVSASRRDDAADGAEKFKDYFEHTEALSKVASHRLLAMFRGRAENVLDVTLKLSEEREAQVPHPAVALVMNEVPGSVGTSARARWLADICRRTWRVKLRDATELALMGEARERAEVDAIDVFGHNLRDLLLAPPAGRKTVLGLDPGYRMGVKCAVVNQTGDLKAFGTIYPHEPQRRRDDALAQITRWVRDFDVDLIAIGNGTASRETDALVAEWMRAHPECRVERVVVSEAGASVYSASAVASREFPDLDVVYRGAVSIARRLQDPLAELLKIDPKAIGVGQYQHDVDQGALARRVDAVVEDCVNAVGVDVNSASVPLLRRVSGLTESCAEEIVKYRSANGPFPSRAALLRVPTFGPKRFQLSAGFLRIPGAADPLDASGVHPESYALVERMAEQTGVPVGELVGNRDAVSKIRAEAFATAELGARGVAAVLDELVKAGRDPRPAFKTAKFKDEVCEISDLKPGMKLEGTVTNVTAFGAFVDVGVHQDGLVHLSQLADRYVEEARDVVRAGDIVTVTVLEVDVERRRISLSMRKDAAPGAASSRSSGGARGKERGKEREKPVSGAMSSALSAAFAKSRR